VSASERFAAKPEEQAVTGKHGGRVKMRLLPARFLLEEGHEQKTRHFEPDLCQVQAETPKGEQSQAGTISM